MKSILEVYVGFGGKIIYNGEIIADIENWKINIYKEIIEIKTFEKTEYADGLKSWEGEAIVIISEKFITNLLQMSTEIVKLELEKDDKLYSGEATLNFEVEFPIKIGDRLEIYFVGSGELKII